MHDFIAHLNTLFTQFGDTRYGPEPVTLKQHALQCAHLAKAAGSDDALIVAAGLHDLGHLLLLEDGKSYEKANDHHDLVAADFLSPYLPGSCTDAIRWHVEAKRYLVANDPEYAKNLSQASIDSLATQGGAMSEAEMQVFRVVTAYDHAIALRRMDEAAKQPDATEMPIQDFLGIVERVASRRL
jgi:predicted HD phosphohydrolase